MPLPLPRPSITVLLATYRGDDALELPFRTLERQTFKDFDVVLVTDNCSVTTTDPKPKFRISRKIEYNQPHTEYMACRIRNLGLPFCNGKLLFLMHDYTEFNPSFLADVWEQSCNGTKAVITKNIVKVYNEEMNAITNTVEAFGFFAHNDAVPTTAMKRVKGFHQMYDGDHGYDDFDLYRKLKRYGVEFVLAPQLVSTKYGTSAYYDKHGTKLEHKGGLVNLRKFDKKWKNDGMFRPPW